MAGATAGALAAGGAGRFWEAQEKRTSTGRGPEDLCNESPPELVRFY